VEFRDRPVAADRCAAAESPHGPAPGTSAGVVARRDHLVSAPRMRDWSGISCSIPNPRPMAVDGICPAMHNTRDEQAKAVATPASALSKPGPGTTMHTPALPVVACIAVGHIGRRLLVAGIPVGNLVGYFGQAIHRVVELDTGYAEHVAHALACELLRQRVAAGH